MNESTTSNYRIWIEGPGPMEKRYISADTFQYAEALFNLLSDTETHTTIALETFDPLKLTWKINRRSTTRSRKRRKMLNG